MWWLNEQLEEMFFPKIGVKYNVLKYLSVIFEIMAFSTHLLGGNYSQVATLFL